MNYQAKVTNEELYNSKVVDVELDFHRAGMNGDVAIEIEGEGWRNITGEHGAHDYEEEFGFVIDPIQYLIYDNSDNSMKPYISFDSDSNTGDIDSALLFDSEEEAKNYINNGGWSEWASVMEK